MLGIIGICAQSTSPFTRSDLDFKAGNVDSNKVATAVEVDELDCLNPQSVFSDLVTDEGVKFIWGSDLERDNTILLRFNAGKEAFDAASYLNGIMIASIFTSVISNII